MRRFREIHQIDRKHRKRLRRETVSERGWKKPHGHTWPQLCKEERINEKWIVSYLKTLLLMDKGGILRANGKGRGRSGKVRKSRWGNKMGEGKKTGGIRFGENCWFLRKQGKERLGFWRTKAGYWLIRRTNIFLWELAKNSGPFPYFSRNKWVRNVSSYKKRF